MLSWQHPLKDTVYVPWFLMDNGIYKSLKNKLPDNPNINRHYICGHQSVILSHFYNFAIFFLISLYHFHFLLKSLTPVLKEDGARSYLSQLC